MKRLGTVIVFKPGTSRAAAEKFVEIGVQMGLVEVQSIRYDEVGSKLVRRPGLFPPEVHDFNDDCGGPVWYIP